MSKLKIPTLEEFQDMKPEERRAFGLTLPKGENVIDNYWINYEQSFNYKEYEVALADGKTKKEASDIARKWRGTNWEIKVFNTAITDMKTANEDSEDFEYEFNSAGSWTRQTFNDDNKVEFTFTDYDRWETKNYDRDGNLIFENDEDNNWQKHTYENGVRVSTEESFQISKFIEKDNYKTTQVFFKNKKEEPNLTMNSYYKDGVKTHEIDLAPDGHVCEAYVYKDNKIQSSMDRIYCGEDNGHRYGMFFNEMFGDIEIYNNVTINTSGEFDWNISALINGKIFNLKEEIIELVKKKKEELCSNLQKNNENS